MISRVIPVLSPASHLSPSCCCRLEWDMHLGSPFHTCPPERVKRETLLHISLHSSMSLIRANMQPLYSHAMCFDKQCSKALPRRDAQLAAPSAPMVREPRRSLFPVAEDVSKCILVSKQPFSLGKLGRATTEAEA